MYLSRFQQQLLFVAVAILGVTIGFVHVMELQHNMYLAESKCVQELINSGIERKNIVTEYGQCRVKSNKAP